MRGVRYGSIPTPGSGEDWEWTPATDSYFLVRAVFSVVTVSGTTALNGPGLYMVLPDGNPIFAVSMDGQVSGGATKAAQFNSDVTANSGYFTPYGEPSIMQIPKLWLPPGSMLGGSTGGGTTTYQWSRLEWITEFAPSIWSRDRFEIARREILEDLEAGG